MSSAFNQKLLAAGVPLRTQNDVRIGARGSRKLPDGLVQKVMVRQPVSLTPSGNTVAITAPSEMPFTANRAVTVQTQVSGGIAGAPRSMRSQGLRGKYHDTAIVNPAGRMPFAGVGEYEEAPAYSGSAGMGDTNWGSIFSTASQVTGQVANVLQPKAAPVAYAPAPKSNTMLYVALGGVAVVGLGLFLMSRKSA